MRQYAFPIFIAVLVIWAVYSLIRRQKNLAAAQEGGDMIRLKEAVAKVLPGESGYKVVCAHYERSTHSGRTTTTYYYTYALAFDAARLWVIPFTFEKDKFLPQSPACITSDSVGVARVNETRKQDQLSQIHVTLRDKEGDHPLEFYVDTRNLKSDRFHHFNIDQREECEQFSSFMASFAQRVTAENGDLESRLTNEALEQSAKRSKLLGILSILFCWLSFAGIILAGVGLFCAPKPKETGGKPAAGFVLCCVGLVLSLLVSVFFLLLF